MPSRFHHFCRLANLMFGSYVPNSCQSFTSTISAPVAATAAPASPTSTHSNTGKAHLTQMTWNSTWAHLPLLHGCRRPVTGAIPPPFISITIVPHHYTTPHSSSGVTLIGPGAGGLMMSQLLYVSAFMLTLLRIHLLSKFLRHGTPLLAFTAPARASF